MSSSKAVSQLVLATLRQINRAMGLRSRQLVKTVGLTVPQLVVLKEVSENGVAAIGHVAEQVSLSQATVTAIVDRLEFQGLITRQRDTIDRRKVMIAATQAGMTVIENNPVILQEEFMEAFDKLEAWEQTQILSSLQHVAAMLKVHQVPSSPIDERWPGEEVTR